MAETVPVSQSGGGASPRPILWIVVPCYNEEIVLPLTAPRFVGKIGQLVSQGKVSPKSKVLFVNDGSSDATWPLIKALASKERVVEGICLSRNRGHQNALLAGLMTACGRADATISIDCDGQDDIDAMDEMVDLYLAGADVVYGVRNDRGTDSAFKRWSAQAFYKLMAALGAETVYNHADYRLLSARVLDALSECHEVNLYLRGLVPLLGFETATVAYKRESRIAGESHYPLSKMMSLAMDGVTSLSIKPIRMVSGAGVAVGLLGVGGIVWVLVSVLFGSVVPGWASLACIVLILGGLQLVALGIIGEYVGKSYLEVKARPRYIVSGSTLGGECDE